MTKRNKHYTLEFKQRAVELSYARGNVSAICKELEVPLSVLHRWRRESGEYGKNSFPGKGRPKLTDDQREISELKRALKDMQLERDILKKAISIFSASDRKNLGS